MKRSEMLDLIFNIVNSGNRNDYIAMDILDAVEEAGMLPPDQLNGCVGCIRCEWEDEDEND